MEWPEQVKVCGTRVPHGLLSKFAVQFLRWQNHQRHDQDLKCEGWKQPIRDRRKDATGVPACFQVRDL